MAQDIHRTYSQSIPNPRGNLQITEPQQNDELLQASVDQQSLKAIHAAHSTQLNAMRDRFPDASVLTLIKFLKARDFDETKAARMYQNHLKWRQNNLPIPYAVVEATLATRKFYMLDSSDRDGRPILVYCLRRFKEMPYVVEKEIKAVIHVLENQGIPLLGPSLEDQKFTVLIDVSGVRAPPLSFLQQMNSVMEANYPESLHKCIMLPVPQWVQKMITTLLVFVAEETRSKFFYVNDIKALEECANVHLEKMGPDIQKLVKIGQL